MYYLANSRVRSRNRGTRKIPFPDRRCRDRSTEEDIETPADSPRNSQHLASQPCSSTFRPHIFRDPNTSHPNNPLQARRILKTVNFARRVKVFRNQRKRFKFTRVICFRETIGSIRHAYLVSREYFTRYVTQSAPCLVEWRTQRHFELECF